MPNGHGGYRKPEHPAPASGPGRLSKRTDGGPGQKLANYTGLDYGCVILDVVAVGIGAMTQMLQGLSAQDTTGALAQLYSAAMTRGV